MFKKLLQKIILWAGFQLKWKSFISSESHRHKGESIILRKTDYENFLIWVGDGYEIFTFPKEFMEKLHSAFPCEKDKNFNRIE